METKTIGNKIAQARKEQSMSQAQLADQLFISAQAVGKWERGESVPDIIMVSKLANILGVDLNYFSGHTQPGQNERGSKSIAGNAPTPEATAPEAKNTLKVSVESRDLTNFNGSDLIESDFAGVTAHKRKFSGSVLRRANFADADITGSSFFASDVSEANFDEANLTDCTLSASDLTDASFTQSILVRTEFSTSGLIRTKFSNTKLVDVKVTKTDLRETIFENCIFEGVSFIYSDLSGLCFNGQTFNNVQFHNTVLKDVSFNGATLRNVSFRATFALTNKYYRAIKTIHFDGAMMDKLTYAALKGIGADLSKVTFL